MNNTNVVNLPFQTLISSPGPFRKKCIMLRNTQMWFQLGNIKYSLKKYFRLNTNKHDKETSQMIIFMWNTSPQKTCV